MGCWFGVSGFCCFVKSLPVSYWGVLDFWGVVWYWVSGVLVVRALLGLCHAALAPIVWGTVWWLCLGLRG